MRSWKIVSTTAAMMLLGVTGCDKIPTWGELTNQLQPAAPMPAAAKVEAAPVIAQPMKPPEPTAEEIIAKFKAMPSHQISDAIITQLTSLNQGLDQVTEINADNSLVTPNAFGSIEKLTNLRQLRLNGTRIDSEACKKIALLSSLEVLAISGTAVGDVGVAAISSMPNLKHLELANCRLTQSAFIAIGHLPALEYLSADSTNMSNEGLNMVCNAKTLREFRLARNPIDDYGLAALKKLNSLESLEIATTGVTGEGLMLASKGGNLKNLKLLGMFGCPMTADGAIAVSHLKSLEKLNLGEMVQLNDLALSQILSGMKKLKCLYLDKCSSITGEGLIGLKGNKEIEELYLNQCSGIGDAVVPFLRTVKSLKILKTNGTAISPSGISALKAAIPDLNLN